MKGLACAIAPLRGVFPARTAAASSACQRGFSVTVLLAVSHIVSCGTSSMKCSTLLPNASVRMCWWDGAGSTSIEWAPTVCHG
jgi:hypothetical protein